MATRTNVLLVVTDEHRFDVMSTHPGSPAITPSLERLAEQGAVFDRCFTPNPICSPARASMLTGEYPSTHGLWSNGVTLPKPEHLVTHELADVGYRCGLIGKLHYSAAYLGRTEQRLDDGFASFQWAHDPFHGSPENAYHRWLRMRHPDLWARAKDSRVTPNLIDGVDFKHDATTFDNMPVEAHYSTWVAEEAVDFLESTPTDTPFFLQVNFFDPHHPFTAPPEYIDKYPPGSVPAPVGGPADLATRPGYQARASQASYNGHGPSYPDYTAEQLDLLRRTYYAMVTLVDECLARVLEVLRSSGRDDDTLVIFTSDHGEMLGDHAILLKGAMLYEPAVRVPMIVRWPGHITPGERVEALVETLDVAATIREAAGLPPAAFDHGISLCAVAKDPATARPYALCQYRDSVYPDENNPILTTMYRTDRYKLVVLHGWLASGGKPDGELYDLVADPDELVNQWHNPEYAGIRSDLYAGLIEAQVDAEDRSAARPVPW